MIGGPLVRAYHLLKRIDLGPERELRRGPLLEFDVGSHPGDNTHYVNAKHMLSMSLLQARLVDLKLPIKIAVAGRSPIGLARQAGARTITRRNFLPTFGL
jgi:hypothetical protein